MEVKTVLAGVAVADLESTCGWYERLLGRAPDDGASDTVLFEIFIDPVGNKIGLLAKRDGA